MSVEQKTVKKEWIKIFLIRISGSRQDWYRRLLPIYGSWRKRQLETRIQKEQKRILVRIGICLLSVCVWGIGGFLSWAGTEQEREKTIEQIMEEGGRLTLEYEDVKREILLNPNADSVKSGPTEKEVLSLARTEISREMLGNNPDWNHVSGPLYFPQQLSSGVYVRYETSNPRRISEQGLVDGIGAEMGIPVSIDVTMFLGTSMEQYTVQCIVVPPETQEEKQMALQLRSETLTKLLNGSDDSSYKNIEEQLNGLKLYKESDRDVYWIFSGMSAFMVVLILISRFNEVERQRETRKKDLAEEVPMLMDQLLMMMNAGLILTEALETAAFSAEEKDAEKVSLCSDLRFLCRRADETKRSVPVLLNEYAVETGCSELIRFSTMLLDHVDRGSSALIQQLKMERNYALETQWKQKEGKCRQMEVQLTGPLLLLLSVILLLTIGPVMISV